MAGVLACALAGLPGLLEDEALLFLDLPHRVLDGVRRPAVQRDDLAGREVALAKKVRSLSPSVAPTPSPEHQPVQVLGPVRYPQSLPSLLSPRAQNSQTAAPPALRCLGVLLCA